MFSKNASLLFLGTPREAAKKVLPLMARPLRPYLTLELNGHRNFFFFSFKIAETDFDNFFSPHNFWTKIALFFGKYCNNQVKIPTDKL